MDSKMGDERYMQVAVISVIIGLYMYLLYRWLSSKPYFLLPVY